jgi:hypothetical protein
MRILFRATVSTILAMTSASILPSGCKARTWNEEGGGQTQAFGEPSASWPKRGSAGYQVTVCWAGGMDANSVRGGQGLTTGEMNWVKQALDREFTPEKTGIHFKFVTSAEIPWCGTRDDIVGNKPTNDRDKPQGGGGPNQIFPDVAIVRKSALSARVNRNSSIALG